MKNTITRKFASTSSKFTLFRNAYTKVLLFRIYRKMVDCYYIKVAQVCSLEGAKVFKQMITTVIDEVINCPCDVKSDPEVKDAMPDQYIQKSIGYVQNHVIMFLGGEFI